MTGKATVEFTPIEEEETREIHLRQDGPDQADIAEWFDSEPVFRPLSMDELKKKIDEERGRDRTMLVAMMSEGKFVGLAGWSASWDPWSPSMGVLVWSDFRRRGCATAAIRQLLDHTFQDSIARVAQAYWVNDFNAAGIGLAKSLGFKPQGALRRTGVRRGRFHDTLVFDMLREEYVKLRRGWD